MRRWQKKVPTSRLSGKGESQPPKKRIVARQETVIMLAYSAMKNMANLKLEYSVWKPATSSVSASGKIEGHAVGLRDGGGDETEKIR